MQQSKPKLKKGSNKGSSNSSVRIIGGSMRGRKISFSSGQGLRPTLDRVRETLFNWLAGDINGSICLDLFAGSGALGFEAISRGAEQVYFVDSSSKATNSLSKNISQIGINNATVKSQTALQFLGANTTEFDLVFLDPPFGKDLLRDCLNGLVPHIGANTLIYVEQENEDSAHQLSDQWEVVKFKQTSSFTYQLIRKK
jgi:16S rRNA (guanine966-N2)-methyltransferase